MTKTELKRFDAVLRAKATELKNAVRNREAIAIGANSDLMDQIQHATERELALDRLERESNIAREVRAALSRIQTNAASVEVPIAASRHGPLNTHLEQASSNGFTSERILNWVGEGKTIVD